jgi:hypothetical protein
MSAPVACFGKLPFHREFLRLGLESPAAGWVVRWIEQAHVAWSRGGEAPATSPLVRFVAPVERHLVVGVVRQSSDGLRRHPVALFIDVAGDLAGQRPELVPLACVPVWAALATLLETEATSLGGLTAALARGVEPPDLGAAETAHAAARAREAAGGAWLALAGAGASPDDARHLALNFVTAARAQRSARSALDGVALAVAIDADPARAAADAGLWIELFAATARSAPAPATLLRPDPGMLVTFYRPPDGRDLSAVLGDLASAPIDDLREVWQPWPPPDGRLESGVERLVSGVPTTFASLREAMGALAGA